MPTSTSSLGQEDGWKGFMDCLEGARKSILT